MSDAASVIVLSLATLLCIAALARGFFRRGTWNVQWWLNTIPFCVSGTISLAVLLGLLEPSLRPPEPWRAVLSSGAGLLLGAAIGLMGYTLGTHRRPLALWHQTDDAPEHIVTEGPYARIRHPFYSSYIIALAGSLLAAPHWIHLLVIFVAAYRLNATAALEEARFLASPLAPAYAAYMRRTGRFVP